MHKTKVFEGIYRDYLAQIQKLDIPALAPKLGVEVEGDGVLVPFFGVKHRVSGNEILDPEGTRPPHSVCVISARYLIMCPQEEPKEAQWVTYRESRDAAPFVVGFYGHAQSPISEGLAGRMGEFLEGAMRLAGERIHTEVKADLAVRFQALSRVPMLHLFNDRDEDFPAQCSILF